jgi:hypothetical protein
MLIVPQLPSISLDLMLIIAKAPLSMSILACSAGQGNQSHVQSRYCDSVKQYGADKSETQ